MIDSTAPDFTNTPVSSKRPCFDYVLADLAVAPHVTIITPFYNTGPVFHETARSVLQQSFQQWEWLIVNDGSTDPDALALLADYRHKDPRIRVIDHPENRGLSAARNTGFREARTDYVVQLDSDDLLEPTAVEKWFWCLESYSEFAFCKGFSVGFGAQEYLWQGGFHEGERFLSENRVDCTSMVRKAIHQAVGGFDETSRSGLEDWDFWLRCASHGHWGHTIPEYLDWYRRRPTHNDRWLDFDEGDRQRAYLSRLREKYPRLWDGGFPTIQPGWHMPNDTVPDKLLSENRLRKDKRRLLLLAPWMVFGGADKFNLDLLDQLTRDGGWEVSIATTLNANHSWLPRFAEYTSDIFILRHFLRLVDYPRFLRYLIRSRDVDTVLVSNSELGYLLLPYLRAHFPHVRFVDYCHCEEAWKNGGYPRMAVDYQELLDLNIVSSQYLKRWMVQRGADPDRIAVCYTNVDPGALRPNPEQRATVRRELGVDDSTPIILYAARLCEQKQPLVFGHTMLELRAKHPSFVALITGDGPDRVGLQSFVDEHGLAHQVRLLGAISNARVKELMAAADVFFLPSKYEGIALSIFEAMAFGLPVVGADVGGQRELVTPECGILISRSDKEREAQQYAEILDELLKNPERRRVMGMAGRARASSEFHLDRMGERMIALFDQTQGLQSRQPRPRPGLGLGRACAAQAVEYVRLFQLAEQIWNDRNRINWRQELYRALRRALEPYYRWCTAHGLTWLSLVKETLKRTLVRSS